MTDPWMTPAVPFCADCCEYLVRDPGAYFCEVCLPTPKPRFPGPPSRLALDTIATTSGDVA